MPTHGLDTAIRARHACAGAARHQLPRPDTLAPRRAAAGHGAPVVAQPRPRTRPARDGARRHGAVAPLDGQHRASLGKTLAVLGWTGATPLAAVLRDGHAEVSVREGAGSPATVPLTIDAAGPPQLPPTLVGGLDLRGGDQVVAIALPGTGELHLPPAGDVLQQPCSTLSTPRVTPLITPSASAPPRHEGPGHRRGACKPRERFPRCRPRGTSNLRVAQSQPKVTGRHASRACGLPPKGEGAAALDRLTR